MPAKGGVVFRGGMDGRRGHNFLNPAGRRKEEQAAMPSVILPALCLSPAFCICLQPNAYALILIPSPLFQAFSPRLLYSETGIQ